jgi:hypothetical protein
VGAGSARDRSAAMSMQRRSGREVRERVAGYRTVHTPTRSRAIAAAAHRGSRQRRRTCRRRQAYRRAGLLGRDGRSPEVNREIFHPQMGDGHFLAKRG